MSAARAASPVPTARSSTPAPSDRPFVPVPSDRSFEIARRALALLLALTPALARAAPPDEAARKAEASRTVAAAQAAFTAGDHAAALAGFTAAMQLRPASGLHYNIGVCHQRLTREAAARHDPDAEARHASAAIEAFNAYLLARPDASDRAAVEDLVRELGGTPATQARLRDPLAGTTTAPTDPPADTATAPTDPPADAATAPTDPPADAATVTPSTAAPTPSTTAPIPSAPRVRGWFGALLGLAAQPQLHGHPGLDGAYQGLLGLRGGARLGARHRLELGAQLWIAVPGETRKSNLALSTQALLLDLGHAFPLGKHPRLELSVGGLVGVAREALHLRPGQTPPPCAVQTAPRLVSARAGGVVGGRLGFAVLVGARRHHELGLHISFAVLGFGQGSAAAPCEERPFAAQSVPRARAMITSALGYALRF